MMELAVADIGGTHARFALARIIKGQGIELSEPWITPVAGYNSFAAAWAAFAALGGAPPPKAIAIAIAGSVDWPESEIPIAFTNNPWVIDPRSLADAIGVERFCLVNDFVAIGHCVANAPPTAFAPVCGPAGDLPDGATITVIGPGTGCGIAHVRRGAQPAVHGTEGAHFGFAPVDSFDDALLARLRKRHGRVSAERVVSGPALPDIAAILASKETLADEIALWRAGLSGSDPLAVQAVERFCMALGSVAGDVALAQGAKAVVIAGGLGLRLAEILPRSGFSARFCAKGRYRPVMERMKVRLITEQQPGLAGAALAFAAMAEVRGQ